MRASLRGTGIGGRLLDLAEARCRETGAEALWLTANRFKDATIRWYLRQGFVTVGEVRKEIGGGFVVDDFIMEKRG